MNTLLDLKSDDEVLAAFSWDRLWDRGTAISVSGGEGLHRPARDAGRHRAGHPAREVDRTVTALMRGARTR